MPLAVNNRILAIISYFSKYASSSFGELAARLGVSVRTVRNDIKQLNDLLQGSASIEADRGTLRLYVYQERDYEEILDGLARSSLGADTPGRRQARLFGLLARATKPMTMADLAGMLFVSRATLAGDVTQLRKDIAGYGLTILGKENEPTDHVYDVTGSLCENNDKFAIDRALPKIDIGDILIIHDTGAHGSAMGFNYNAKLHCAELLRCMDGSIELIRRPQTIDDYFATLKYEGSLMK